MLQKEFVERLTDKLNKKIIHFSKEFNGDNRMYIIGQLLEMRDWIEKEVPKMLEDIKTEHGSALVALETIIENNPNHINLDILRKQHKNIREAGNRLYAELLIVKEALLDNDYEEIKKHTEHIKEVIGLG